MEAKLKAIVDARDYRSMVPFGQHPSPGEYVLTGPQVGNLHGEKGWHFYVGYVVQVRKKAGAYGTDMVILRHPNGMLVPHENQSFHRLNDYWESRVKDLFPPDLVPENEDYSLPYTLNGKYPEVGQIIEAPAERDLSRDPGPLAMITVSHPDGTKIIEAV